jgi:cell wall-associated NlpC family hydrolase
MKLRLLILLAFPLFLASCGAKRAAAPKHEAKTTHYQPKVQPAKPESRETPEKEHELLPVIETAVQYLGTKYLYGGATKAGMDCSGLIYTAFLEEGYSLPRSSREMSLLGDRLDLKEVAIGDLLFFQTDKKKKVINHVGLVVETDGPGIQFIHSSTSRGVIISGLDENYWQDHFIMARRIN